MSSAPSEQKRLLNIKAASSYLVGYTSNFKVDELSKSNIGDVVTSLYALHTLGHDVSTKFKGVVSKIDESVIYWAANFIDMVKASPEAVIYLFRLANEVDKSSTTSLLSMIARDLEQLQLPDGRFIIESHAKMLRISAELLGAQSEVTQKAWSYFKSHYSKVLMVNVEAYFEEALHVLSASDIIPLRDPGDAKLISKLASEVLRRRLEDGSWAGDILLTIRSALALKRKVSLRDLLKTFYWLASHQRDDGSIAGSPKLTALALLTLSEPSVSQSPVLSLSVKTALNYGGESLYEHMVKTIGVAFKELDVANIVDESLFEGVRDIVKVNPSLQVKLLLDPAMSKKALSIKSLLQGVQVKELSNFKAAFAIVDDRCIIVTQPMASGIKDSREHYVALTLYDKDLVNKLKRYFNDLWLFSKPL